MISIIIPSLDSPHIGTIIKIIKEQKQNFKDIELIIVGKDTRRLLDGETDVIFIDTGIPVSPARARNIGIKSARGEVIIFLDSDCIPEHKWLEKLLEASLQGRKVVGGAVQSGRGNLWQIADNVIHFYNSHPSRRGDVVLDGPLPTANLCVSRDAMESAGLFSEALVTGEDFEYSMRLRGKGYLLNFERRALVLHLTNRTTLFDILKHSNSWAKNSIFIRKRFSPFLKTPFFMKNGFILYLASPLIACLAAFKIFFTSPGLLQYWYTIPVIYLSKLIWSITAAEELINAR